MEFIDAFYADGCAGYSNKEKLNLIVAEMKSQIEKENQVKKNDITQSGVMRYI